MTQAMKKDNISPNALWWCTPFSEILRCRDFSTFSLLDKHKLKDFKRDVENMARFRICARALVLTAVR